MPALGLVRLDPADEARVGPARARAGRGNGRDALVRLGAGDRLAAGDRQVVPGRRERQLGIGQPLEVDPPLARAASSSSRTAASAPRNADPTRDASTRSTPPGPGTRRAGRARRAAPRGPRPARAAPARRPPRDARAAAACSPRPRSPAPACRRRRRRTRPRAPAILDPGDRLGLEPLLAQLVDHARERVGIRHLVGRGQHRPRFAPPLFPSARSTCAEVMPRSGLPSWPL